MSESYRIFGYITFCRVLKLAFFFNQAKSKTKFKLVPIQSFGVEWCGFFNLLVHFHLGYQGQLDVGSLQFCYPCTAVFTPFGRKLKFLIRA